MTFSNSKINTIKKSLYFIKNSLAQYDLQKCINEFNIMRKNDYNVQELVGSIDGEEKEIYYYHERSAINTISKELADKNIAVNAVTPAGAKTRILKQMSKEHVERMLSKVPRGRFLEIEEFTSLICWLSSEENSFSTAAVFDISGGRSTY